MADKGISVISHNGEDYNINDPNIAGEFYPNSNYAIGDHVTHEGKLYVFTAAHTGAWTGTDVTQVQIGAELHDYGAHAMVRYDVAQTLTDAQKTVARSNIAAANAELEDKIGTVPSGTTVENQIFAQGTQISTNASNIDALQRQVGTVPTGETVEGQITDLKSAIGTVPIGRTVQGQITDHGTRITTLEGDMTDAKRDIDALDGEFMDLSVGLSILEPNATAEDVGKALIAKTVNGGKAIEYEFGETTEIDDTAGEGDTEKTWSADKLSQIKPGLTDEAKECLMDCFKNVAWINENGVTYLNNLRIALGMFKTLELIYPNNNIAMVQGRILRTSSSDYTAYVDTTKTTACTVGMNAESDETSSITLNGIYAIKQGTYTKITCNAEYPSSSSSVYIRFGVASCTIVNNQFLIQDIPGTGYNGDTLSLPENPDNDRYLFIKIEGAGMVPYSAINAMLITLSE